MIFNLNIKLISKILIKFSVEFYLEFDALNISLYYLSVMLSRLPETIDPTHLADIRGELKGQVPISNLDRLTEMLVIDLGSVDVDLYFSREGRVPIVEGRIKATLQLQCQNCLEAVEWSFDETIKLGIVTTIEQANRLPEELEPLMIEEEKILLKSIIEDEILLNLPAFPKHEYECFAAAINTNTNEHVVNEETPSHKNPFAILAKLKKTGDS